MLPLISQLVEILPCLLLVEFGLVSVDGTILIKAVDIFVDFSSSDPLWLRNYYLSINFLGSFLRHIWLIYSSGSFCRCRCFYSCCYDFISALFASKVSDCFNLVFNDMMGMSHTERLCRLSYFHLLLAFIGANSWLEGFECRDFCFLWLDGSFYELFFFRKVTRPELLVVLMHKLLFILHCLVISTVKIKLLKPLLVRKISSD